MASVLTHQSIPRGGKGGVASVNIKNLTFDNSASHCSFILIDQLSKACHKLIEKKLCSVGKGTSRSTVTGFVVYRKCSLKTL